MKVERVYLKNFKAFDELDLVLNENDADPPSLVALIGDNGSGKTSVLEAIATLAHLWHEPFPEFGWGVVERRAGQEMLAYVDLRVAEAELGDIGYSPPTDVPRGPHVVRVASHRGGHAARVHERAGQGMRGLFAARLHGTGSHLGGTPNGMPISNYHKNRQRVSYVRADRVAPRSDVRAVQRVEGLPRGLLMDHGFTDLKQHLVDLNYLRLVQGETGEGGNPLEPYAALVARLFTNKTFERIDAQLHVLFRTSDGLSIDYDQLSAGERSVLALVSSLIRGELRRSVFLIDEPEQHLHPRWQAELPKVLAEQARLFDNQFILATHSVEVAEGVQAAGGVVFDLSPEMSEVSVSTQGRTT